MIVKYLDKLLGHPVIAGLFGRNKILSITASMALLFLPQGGHAAGKEILATCDSPFVQSLLNAPLSGSPRDDAWMLLVLDRIQIVTRSCAGLDRDAYAVYLKRLFLNDVMAMDIPAAKTFSDAVRIEHELMKDVADASALTVEELQAAGTRVEGVFQQVESVRQSAHEQDSLSDSIASSVGEAAQDAGQAADVSRNLNDLAGKLLSAVEDVGRETAKFRTE